MVAIVIVKAKSEPITLGKLLSVCVVVMLSLKLNSRLTDAGMSFQLFPFSNLKSTTWLVRLLAARQARRRLGANFLKPTYFKVNEEYYFVSLSLSLPGFGSFLLLFFLGKKSILVVAFLFSHSDLRECAFHSEF